MSRHPRKIMVRPPNAEITEEEIRPLLGDSVMLPDGELVATPSGWHIGALLNVRNYGSEYIITLWPEELSQEQKGRAISFTNPSKCQDFVSKWYARDSHNPLARRTCP